jgi:hypothetical protein
VADNVAIDPGTTTTIATDDIAGVQFQRMKMAAGADGSHVGDVSGRTVDGGTGAALFVDPRPSVVRVAVTPTISTSAYTIKDAVGGLMTFANAARAAGGSCRLRAVQIVDKAQQRADLDLVLFDRSITAPTDNAVFDPTDAELANVVGMVSIGQGDYADFNDNSVATIAGLGDVIVLDGTSLFGVLVTRDAQTYASTSDLVVTLTIDRD